MMDKRKLQQLYDLRQSKKGRSFTRVKISAFESEIPPLRKPEIYEKAVFHPPRARKREEVMS